MCDREIEAVCMCVAHTSTSVCTCTLLWCVCVYARWLCVCVTRACCVFVVLGLVAKERDSQKETLDHNQISLWGKDSHCSSAECSGPSL